MDTLMIERALTESFVFSDASNRVAELEREFERLRQQIAAFEDESEIIATQMEGYRFQFGGPIWQATLHQKLRNADAAAAKLKKEFSEVSAKLGVASAERDRIRHEFHAKLA